jgi:hypothetical protein
VFADEQLELGHRPDVLSEGQLRFQPVLDRHRSQLLEPRDLGLPEGGMGELGQRRAPPQRQSLRQSGASLGGPASGEQAVTFGGQGVEAGGVEPVGINAQQIARSSGDQHLGWGPRETSGLEDLAQIVHVGLQRSARAGRRLFPPQQVDETVHRHHAVGVDQQHGQHRPLLGRPETHRFAAVPHLQRAQYLEVHPPRLPVAIHPPKGREV